MVELSPWKWSLGGCPLLFDGIAALTSPMTLSLSLFKRVVTLILACPCWEAEL